jgi:glycosyltransferase involved in cell wall biosynthesis
MQFINTTKNSVNLSDVGIIVPYLEDLSEQYIATENVSRSTIFQELCMVNPSHFIITKIETGSRMEKNLLAYQKGDVNFTKPEQISVTYRGHVCGIAGYAKANRNMIYSLARQNVDVCLDPISGINGLSAAELARLEMLKSIQKPDAILIHSTIPGIDSKPEARYSILYTTIESSTIPKQFVDSCELYDEIWVVSDFCRDILISAGVMKNIYVVPNGIDSRVYSPLGKKHSFQPSLKKFKFVSVLSWNYRKGFDALLKAYLKEFTSTDPVSLLLVTPYEYKRKHINDNIGKAIRDIVNSYPDHAHVARCGYPIIETDMPKMYRACDSFVLPSRGEGFGLPYLEAGLCGLPIIATNHSGHTMFLNKLNSNLVDIDQLKKLKSGVTQVHYWDNQLFPALDSEDFINRFGKEMRFVFDNYAAAKEKNKLLQDDILNGYTCEAVGSIAKKRLEVIWNKL